MARHGVVRATCTRQLELGELSIHAARFRKHAGFDEREPARDERALRCITGVGRGASRNGGTRRREKRIAAELGGPTRHRRHVSPRREHPKIGRERRGCGVLPRRRCRKHRPLVGGDRVSAEIVLGEHANRVHEPFEAMLERAGERPHGDEHFVTIEGALALPLVEKACRRGFEATGGDLRGVTRRAGSESPFGASDVVTNQARDVGVIVQTRVACEPSEHRRGFVDLARCFVFERCTCGSAAFGKRPRRSFAVHRGRAR
jgi:hypothetical protein